MNCCIVMFSREKCASARVQVGVVSTPPSRSWQLLLSGREAARFSNFCRRANGTKTEHCNQNSQVDIDKVEFLAYACCFEQLLEREFDVVVFHHWSDHLSSCHFCGGHFCQLLSP